ncbi:MAG: DUF5606 domain-containing protein [Bacteroidota bacterium]|nr:DUF5606 domain-containing protein [Bacteroidota bacterium]
MKFKEIAAISGKGGLYKITKPTRTGVIVESIDDKNTRMVASATNRISILKEISVYTTTKEGSTPLEEVLRKIYEEFQDDPGVTTSSEPDELKAFIKFVVPDYDPSRVYVSDIKKILGWYNILVKYAPEVFQKEEEEEVSQEEAVAVNETVENEVSAQQDKPEKTKKENKKEKEKKDK